MKRLTKYLAFNRLIKKKATHGIERIRDIMLQPMVRRQSKSKWGEGIKRNEVRIIIIKRRIVNHDQKLELSTTTTFKM